jgi:hypothetical protein
MVRERTAALINRLSRRIENAVGPVTLADSGDAADASSAGVVAAGAGHWFSFIPHLSKVPRPYVVSDLRGKEF